MTHPLRIDGIDLSNFQTQKIDYAAAKKAGVRFVYHKATEGSTFADANYAKRRAEAKAAGLPFGGYHFAQPNGVNAVSEAHWFLQHAAPVPGDLLPALDLEVNPHNLSTAQLTVWAVSWWQVVQNALGIKTGVTYTPFDLIEVAHTYLWAARYSNDNAAPHIPRPWKNFTIRQFSDGKFGVPNSVPGVGHADINHIRNGFLGVNRLTWKKRLTIPQPAKPTPPPPVQHRVSTFNVEFGHKPVAKWAAMVLDRFETLQIDVLALNEIQDYFPALQKAATAKGHSLVGLSLNSRNAVLVRKGLKVGTVGTVPGTVSPWVDGTRSMSLAKPVVVTVDGITYVAQHAPVDAWTVTRAGRTFTGPATRAYKQHTTNLVKFLSTVSGPVVILGDWNVTPNQTGTYSADWVRAKGSAVWVRPSVSTGHGEIDFGIARGASKIGSAVVIPQTEFLVPGETGGSESGQHSDHLQVYWDLTY